MALPWTVSSLAGPVSGWSFQRLGRGLDETFELFASAVEDPKGVRVEDLFLALGVYSGLACQLAVFVLDAKIKSGEMAPPATGGPDILVATDNDGDQWFFGDMVNALTVESARSFYNVLSEQAQARGAPPAPDPIPIFSRQVGLLGGPDYAKPDTAPRYEPVLNPETFLRSNFGPISADLHDRITTDAFFAAIHVAHVSAEALRRLDQIVPPAIGYEIILTGLIAYSKRDPRPWLEG